MECWAGFDVGGQSVKAVLADTSGTIIASARRPTGLDTDVAGLAGALQSALEALGGEARQPKGIGVGLAGVIGRDGILQGSPNLPRLVGHHVERALSERLERQVEVDNDANVAALAEGWIGAAAGCEDFLLVTVGSGVGSGLVAGGKLYHGATGYACELGHTILVQGGRRCGCGNAGCLEAYVSESAARSILSDASEDLRRQAESLVRDRDYGHAQAVFSLADEGLAEAIAVADSMVEALATGLASAVNLLDVPTIVIGGGIAPAVLARRALFERAMDAALFSRSMDAVRVVAASCGNDAGALGAARLAMRAL